jgi:hypothetical protein
LPQALKLKFDKWGCQGVISIDNLMMHSACLESVTSHRMSITNRASHGAVHAVIAHIRSLALCIATRYAIPTVRLTVSRSVRHDVPIFLWKTFLGYCHCVLCCVRALSWPCRSSLQRSTSLHQDSRKVQHCQRGRVMVGKNCGLMGGGAVRINFTSAGEQSAVNLCPSHPIMNLYQ